MEERMELEFQKMNLIKDDIVIVKVNTEGMNETEAFGKLSTIRNDEFVKFLQDKGHPVIIAYSGISFEKMRLEPDEKVIAYINVSSMTDEQAEKYQDYIKFKLSESIGEDKLIMLPVKHDNLVLKRTKEENNE